jgi:hypothetical protein
MYAASSLDGFTSILVGLSIAFITITTINLLISSISCKPEKSFEDTIASRTACVIHRSKTLNVLVNSLYSIDHPDADLFSKAVSVLNINYDDHEVNAWILRTLVVLDANVNNRIDSIKTNDGVLFSDYLDSHYENESDTDESEIDESSEEVIEESGAEESGAEEVTEDEVNTSTDSASSEAEQEPEQEPAAVELAPRVVRADTYYSGSGSASGSSEILSTTPPNSENDTSGDSEASNEAINTNSESKTTSEEQS